MSERANGFTLVEMLAATALAAMLMIALLTVTASLGRTRAVVTRIDARKTWQVGVLRIVRSDLGSAATITPGLNAVTLEGPLMLDVTDHSATQRLGSVRYELRNVAGRSWLVREQRDRDPLRRYALSVELVCPDVRQISLVVRDGSHGFAAQSAVKTARLSVESAEPGAESINETIVLR